jgi:glucosamine--fructose-6-phosphate aminotransferase (isomerizing)
MLKEIDEQPTVMRKLISAYTNEAGQVTVDADIIKAVQEADRIYILAAGTSYHAGFASKDFLEKLTDTPVELGISSEWGYNMPLLSKKPLFVMISQSGETADSRQVLVKANEMGIPSLTVTNVPGSTLSREATYTMLLHAGPEIAVASTKAYTAQIATLAVLAKAVGDANGNAYAKDFDLVHELSIVAQSIEASLSEKDVIAEKVEKLLATTRNAFYIGRGSDYYVSMEASLKLKEISYIQCEGFAAGELKHGTISLIEDGVPVLALISNHPHLASHTRGNIQEVVSRGANVLTIVDEAVAKEEDDITVTTVHPFLSAIAMVVPTQLIAYYATLQRGLDVDKPRNLAKSVTVE